MPEALPQQHQWPKGPPNDLHRAAHAGATMRTVALLSKGSLDVNQATTPEGYTALMFGAMNGHADIVRILLSKGADASIVGYDGFAALHLAAQDGHPAVAGLLLEAGANINLQAQNSDGGTALLMAAQKGHLDVLTMLIDAGADLRETTCKGSSPLHIAAHYGHLEVIKVLVKAGADPRAKTSDDMTPLHVAAQNGYFGIMIALMNAGADPRAKNSSGFAPLHAAAQNGHSEVVSGLMKAGADLQATASLAFTPLHLAAKNGHVESTRALVKAGADMEVVTSEGDTPLHLAATEGHSEVVQALIDEGGNPDAPLPDGLTPLLSAAGGGHVEVVRVLLRAKANPLLAVKIHRPGKTSKTSVPLDMAAFSGHAEVVRELIQQVGIEGCGGASGGADALGIAAATQHSEVVVVLAEAGVVDTGEALILAAGAGDETAVKALLQQQEERGSADGAAYVNARDEVGRTALLKAICRCSPRVVRLLVDAGADTTSAVPIAMGAWLSNKTPLNIVTRMIRAKDVAGEVVTEEQLHRLEGIRRLLVRVGAVHAESWLWHRDVPILGRASLGRAKISSAPLRMMLPALRRKAGRRVILLGACSGEW